MKSDYVLLGGRVVQCLGNNPQLATLGNVTAPSANMNVLASEREFVADLAADFVRFWESPTEGKFVLVHHGDPDGCCAAALSILWAERTKRPLPDKVLWVGTSEFDFAHLLNELDALNSTKVAFLDVNIANVPEALERLMQATSRRVAIYDDHATNFAVARSKLLYLNPSLKAAHKREVPPCLFAYLLDSEDEPRNAWMACTGLIGESLADDYRDFLARFTAEEIKDCRRAVRLLSSYYLAEEEKQLNTALNRVLTSARGGGLGDFLDRRDPTSAYLSEIADDVRREVDRQTEAEESLVVEGRIGAYKCRVYEIESRFRIANLVASQKRWKFKGEVVLVFQRLKDRIMIEARRLPAMDDLDLSSLLQDISRKVPVINVGGHPRAAGAAIRYENRKAFLEQLRQIP